MTLPKDLAGYQQIFVGHPQPGDLYGDSTFAYPMYFKFVAPCDPWIAHRIEDIDPVYAIRFYRKMDCPMKLDPFTKEYAMFIESAPIDNSYKALTNDKGKPPLAMLPWAGINEVALVQEYGNQKYGSFSNYRKGMEVTRHLSCAIRHIAKYLSGETLDQESGRPHLAHAACRILYVLQNIHDNVAIDDRYTK